MYVLNAATGRILWSFASGGSVAAGPAIVAGSVYWGSGYSKSGSGSASRRLYAFDVVAVKWPKPPSTGIAQDRARRIGR